ncbi:hypothetical protein MD484_g2036, partial [Candolleomyces efflorescens]
MAPKQSVNVNHLLNFSLPPRETRPYRFVMNPNGDYTVHFADPDMSVVTLYQMNPGSQQLKKVKWYDGPIRSENVDEGAAIDGNNSSPSTTLRTGSTLEMRLIQRPQITTLALPRSQTWPSDLLSPHQAPFHFQPDVLNFAKFMLATPDYLVAELTKELTELAQERRMFVGMNDDLGLYFVNEASEGVRHQIAKAEALDNPALTMQIEKARRDQKELLDRSALHARRQEADQEARAGKESNGDQDVPSDFLASRAPATTLPLVNASQRAPPPQGRSTPRQRRNLNPPPPSTSTYYYYQAASGLPIFLHPIDIRILVSHFNGYPSFPDRITIRVDGTSESTVNDELRKRCKYLAHFPEGADVIFVEADLLGVVGPEGLKDFEKALKSRSTKRQEKLRKDDRAKARAEKEEKEKERMALARFTNVSVRPREDVGNAEFVSLASSSPPYQNGSPPDTEEVASSTPPAAVGAWGSRPSFASALHSTSSSSAVSTRGAAGQPRRRDLAEEDWEADQIWHDLEQRALTGGGRKKRGTRMVVLGGSGAPTSRRR